MTQKRRIYTPGDFMTKKGAQQVLMDLTKPLLPFYSESGARLYIGHTSAHYEDDTISMEAFSRVLWGLVPFFAGGGHAPEMERLCLSGLTCGSDPSHPDYWHPCHDYDQKFCEMPAIALSLLLCPKKFWDPLTEKAKANLCDWLYEINRHECCACNWQFFLILTNVALLKLSRPYDKERLQKALERMDSYYEGGGWYSDGEDGNKDYYNPFVMVTFGVLYAMFMEREDPTRCRIYRQRARAFGKDFLYWFSDDGSSFAYGRSQTYRFAQVTFFSACLLAGVDILPLTILKGLIARHLCLWLNRPIFDNAGILTIGYGYPNLQMSEGYNAPGSVYWALNAFLFLGLPDNHPFWSAAIAPLPLLEKQKFLPHANMLIQRGKNQVVAFPAGALLGDGGDHRWEKYARFTYSSRYGFSIARSNFTLAEAAPESVLSFEVDGLFYTKGKTDDFAFQKDGLVINWSPLTGIDVQTTIILTKNGHIRTHVIESNLSCKARDCGFALPLKEKEKSILKKESAAAWVAGKGEYCRVLSEKGQGDGEILFPAPNTNILYSKTVVPAIVYEIRPGRQTLVTRFEYLEDSTE